MYIWQAFFHQLNLRYYMVHVRLGEFWKVWEFENKTPIGNLKTKKPWKVWKFCKNQKNVLESLGIFILVNKILFLEIE